MLAQILEDDRRLIAESDRLEESRRRQLVELKALGRKGSVDVDALSARRYHAGQLAAEKAVVEHNRQIVSQQVELCRQTLTKAEQELKVLEKLKERRLEEFQYDQERRSAHELEETWLAAHAQEYAK
jgi:flagellar biosynthesis chaperone FliJ